MPREKKLTNKFNIGDRVNMPMIITGIRCYNGHIYYELKSADSNKPIIFKVFDPDEEIYPKNVQSAAYNCERGSRITNRIVEEDLVAIKNSSKKLDV